MILPNFLVIGPPRTATTWLFRCIHTHPQIYIPEIKQVHYFDKHYDKGLEWYSSFFQNALSSAVVIGDITPDYLAHPETPARIYQTLGENIKLFIIFRDPVERAFSEFRMKQRLRTITSPFLEALHNHAPLVENSLYAKHIQRIRAYFPDKCLSILSYEHIQMEPLKYLKRFFATLGVEDDYIPESLQQRVNKGLPEARLPRLVHLSVRVRKAIEYFPLGRRMLWLLREKGVISLWHRYTSEESREECSQPLREAASHYFADDLASLKSLEHLFLL